MKHITILKLFFISLIIGGVSGTIIGKFLLILEKAIKLNL